MATISDLVKRSMRTIGILEGGEEPISQDIADALLCLNGLLDAWNLDDLMIYDTQLESFTLTPSQLSYTIGSSGNFNTVRPLKIEQSIYRMNGIDYPMSIISKTDYESIPQKTATSNVPTHLYYEPSYPLGIIYLYPVPTLANSLRLVTLKQLTSVALGDTISLPPGYNDCIVYNLALALAAEFSITNIAPMVIKLANELKQKVKAANEMQTFRPIRLDSALTTNNRGSGYSIYSDGYKP